MKSFILEPHTAIVGDVKRQTVLNMTSKESEGCRRVSVDLVKEEPKKLMRMLQSLKPEFQKSLNDWLPKSNERHWNEYKQGYLSMPRNINWKILKEIYEFQPANYEELLGLKGVGPTTVRGLALVAEMIYGEKPSWKDPVKYSFAYGGKDGVPYPVDRRSMDESINFLKHAVEETKIGDTEKLRSLRSLTRFITSQ